jgi:hypothetical protein
MKLSRVTYNWTMLILTMIFGISRVYLMPDYIEDYDGVYFVSALEKYSVTALSPHFPGYPVFVWLGNAVNILTRDPVLALHLVSSLATTLAGIPIAGLAFQWSAKLNQSLEQARMVGIIAALLWWLIPVTWVDGTEIFSDPLGTALCAVMLTLAWQGSQIQSAKWSLPSAAVIAGLLLGVRLQYVAFLPVLILAWYWRRKTNPLEPVIYFWAGLFIPIIIWFGWQLSIDGMVFFQAASSTAIGHYSNWGVSATTDPNPLSRPIRILETISVLGLGGWWVGEPWTRAVISILWLIGFGLGVWTLWQKHRLTLWFSSLFLLPHLLWWVSSFDPVTARYTLPIVILLCVVTAIGLGTIITRGQWIFTPVFLTMLGVISLPLAREHQQSLPLEFQIAMYFQDRPNLEDILLFQPSPSLHLQMALPQLQLEKLPLTSVGANRTDLTAFGREVFGSSYRLEPFRVAAWWQPVKRFCRSRYLRLRTTDTLEATIYRYQPKKVTPKIQPSSIPQCSIQ